MQRDYIEMGTQVSNTYYVDSDLIYIRHSFCRDYMGLETPAVEHVLPGLSPDLYSPFFLQRYYIVVGTPVSPTVFTEGVPDWHYFTLQPDSYSPFLLQRNYIEVGTCITYTL